MGATIVKTRDELIAWRRELLCQVNMDKETFYTLGLSFELRAFAEHLGAESVCAPLPPAIDEFRWKPALLGEGWLRFERDR